MGGIDYIDGTTGIVIEKVRTDKRFKKERITCIIEGLELELEIDRMDDAETEAERKKRLYSYLTKEIRAKSGMNRVQFAMWLGIPYRTMQEWEIGRRLMPDYLLRLIAYKVNSERKAGRLVK
jgi:DNA-binding transcriptional regulator YiaG